MKIHPEYLKLLENNKSWVKEKTTKDPDFFSKLSKGQSPRFLWIGCSDSRVPANEITNTEPGDIFVARNVANLVVHTDINLLSVLDYAIKVLKVEHILVVGHYGCGGVLAAMGNDHFGLIDNWLRNIKDVYRLHQVELDSIHNLDERARRLVELNIVEQVYNLCKTTTVQEAWSQNQKLQVHGWVYDVADGLIKDMDVNISGVTDILEVYQFDFE